MASALWNAAASGNVENVLEIFNEDSNIDIEMKDQRGFTPLIEAIKNGHVEVVRVLLEKGADPMNGPGQAEFKQYSTDPAILDLLHQYQPKVPNGIAAHEPAYVQELNREGEAHFYPPPPAPYHFYHGAHVNGMPVRDGSIAYYPPPPPQPSQPQNAEIVTPGGTQNLPPPEVARLIPCRYFPACRYGASCIFLHPQGPFFQGPLPPPAQYPPYDPMSSQPYAPNFYPAPPPSFQPSPPNGIHHMTPVSTQHPSPHPSIHHVRSNSEIRSPQGPYNHPQSIPPPANYPMTPISPLYNHGPVPPNSIPVQAINHQPPPPGPMPFQPMYNGTSPPAPFVPHEMNGQYPQPPLNGSFPEADGVKISPTVQTDGFDHANSNREGMGHYRRGSMRRSSIGGGRKPPCLFFPAGKCKNGDDCRFPHIADGPVHQQPHFAGRGGFRSRPHVNGNSMGRLEEKMGGMTVQDESSPQTSRSQSSDGTRPRYPFGSKPNGINGHQLNKRPPVKQRVPNADEFPVLSGSITPPARSPGTNGSHVNGNGQSGPTAAQVLQAPAPTRKDSKDLSMVGSSSGSKPNKENHDLSASILEKPLEPSVAKRQFAFGAVNSVSDIGKEVSITA